MPQATLRRSDVPAIIAKVDARQLTRRGQPVIRVTVKNFGERAAGLVGNSVRFNEQNARVVRFIRKWGAENVTGMINKTTRDRLRTVLVRGIEQGQGYEAMGKAIGHVFDVAQGSRSVMIARTEVHRASNFASLEGYKQAGVEEKEWQHSAGGDQPRETHEEMDGQTVGIDDDFESPTGDTAPYPGEFGDAADDANCQCGVLPVVNTRALRPSSRSWVARTTPRLMAPHVRKMRGAMQAGFAAQRKSVVAAFEARADKGEV